MALEYLLHYFLSSIEREDLEERLKRLTEKYVEKSITASRRKKQLESDLARVTLVARTLADLCIAKGLITSEEFARQLVKTDFADGALESKLAEPGERRLAQLEPLDTQSPPEPQSERVAKILKERKEKKLRGKS